MSCRNYAHESRCVARCPSGTYATFDRLCLRCHRECITCYGPTKKDCVACRRQKSEKKLYVDVTKQGSCVMKCPLGFHVRNETLCAECPSHCDVCTDGALCTTCSRDFLLASDSKCVSTCPEGQYPDIPSRKCVACDESCATCVGSRPSQCGLCKANSFYYERSCIDRCPSGFFADLGKKLNILHLLIINLIKVNFFDLL